MKNQAYYDEENGVMRENYIGDAVLEELSEHFVYVAKLFEGKEHRYSIIDLSEASNKSFNKKTRNLIAKESQKVGYEKVAYIGTNPILRMIAKVIQATAKMSEPGGSSSEVRFCKTEEEALVWLKGEK